jgi:tetratricopeptide (TPR) repeat protein
LPDAPEEAPTTSVGNISGGKGFAIGTNARSTFIEIGSLLDLTALVTTVRRHWLLVLISLVLQGTGVVVWREYTDRFLIPAWVLFAGIFLVEALVLSVYLLPRQSKQKWISSLCATGSLLGLSGLIGFQYQQIFHPDRFDTADFGVAIAHFGEGPNLKNTPRAQEISQLVLERLTQQAQENPDLRFVQFKPIGLVRTESEAREEGEKIAADLVIWGRLQISDAATTLNFAVIETPDKISNPTFPRVTPFIENSATGTLQISGNTSQEIANGTTTIAAFTFGLAHFFNWDFIHAAPAFKQALATSPSASETYLYLLHLYYGLSLQWPGQLEFANEQFRLAATIYPEDPAAKLAMAFGNRSLGNLEQASVEAFAAAELITRYIKLHPDNAMAFYNRALANEILRDWSSALSDYQTAVNRESDLYVARIGVIRMNLVLQRPAEAIQAAHEAVELAEANDANPAWAYLYLAQAFERNQDPEQAKLAFENATRWGGQVDWIRFQAGQFYSSIGDLESAEHEYRSMIDVSSNQPWAYATLAKFYAANNRLDEAITEFQSALQIDPSIDGVWVELAGVYARQGQYREAENAYQRAINTAKRPSNLYYNHFSYGNFLYRQGRFEDALDQWESAHELEPKQCGLMLNMGSAHENLSEAKHAQEIYSQILLLNHEENADCIAEAQKRLSALVP